MKEKEIDKAVLPGEAILIKRDKRPEKTDSGIYLGEDVETIISTGIIIKVGIELTLKTFNSDWQPVGQRVRFKEAFGEILMIDDEEYIFFRELEPSIYYYINEKN